MNASFSATRFLAGLLLIFVGSLTGQADEKTPDRWEKDIVDIERRINQGKSPKEAVLFVGSSSIRLWNLEESFPSLKVLNHGFGGSYLSESVHFFDRIVTPVKPAIIVVYAGDNDIAAGKSPETVHADFLAFVAKMEMQVPECKKVIYISIKPSIKRWAMAETIKKANSMIQESCEKSDKLEFLDIWTAMLDDKAVPNASLLVEDGLHMNKKGYQIWSEALLPHLITRKDATKE